MSDDEKKPDGNVVPIGVAFKDQKPAGPILQLVYPRCFHGPFLIDHDAAEVTCKACGEKLDPMAVLRRLAAKESEYRNLAERYQAEMKRLGERSRTKCQNCGKITRISR